MLRHAEEVPLPTSPVASPHERREEIPLPTSPVTSPADGYAEPLTSEDAPTESPSEDLPVPQAMRPSSEPPSYEEIEVLLDEAALRAEGYEAPPAFWKSNWNSE